MADGAIEVLVTRAKEFYGARSRGRGTECHVSLVREVNGWEAHIGGAGSRGETMREALETLIGTLKAELAVRLREQTKELARLSDALGDEP